MITHLISSELRRKLLTHYFSHPDGKYYVRELGVLLNLDPGNLSKELRIFEKEGLFHVEKKGNLKFYVLNSGCPLYGDLKQVIFKTTGVEGSLRSVVDRFEDVALAFIYGSYAKGGEKAGSDIDVVIVGSPERRRLTSEIRKLEELLGREINFNLYAEEEFKNKSAEKGSFLAEVVRGKKIILKGNLNG
ncbi:MAG: hypothetical protein A3G33_10805 [Omnitrophica bacterium RIFCSPLOWO2_12_FULL_44_17]|uniref:HTH arsR-type domain-containing protein n=1 Tax=Candidatus Danuiimicrobium aquiferis TaxID=1801832 RepID=A0A1G1KRC3_9BACT|nr:MAG: hypothetical protein A3B72_03125 [Omnitrophica bacterium RIFCSPHIGHO2_02_FULL_45_28]OGW88964.1 MAG: hypothetical protein A3E74_07105 [Omnitrophica bacterium RIFCSPHIGHO2_12_FULL_44_12]OGW95458.1 MAG: hypothetical protein A3G33_10805 [Omnitrophica bacterium RIFCSPLOWO2_12_FULL_44_17]OGX03337.1 MAG: hypothetical protein A3J12_07440 [Omnitrophica bacterium RIFCSPLOWO2_02_FULL_44_11]